MFSLNQIQYLIFISFLVLFSCQKDVNEILIDEYIPFQKPSNFPSSTYEFTDSNVKDEAAVFELGKSLFYEPKLSLDNSISCAECHNQSFVFTHHGHVLSSGVNEAPGVRNTHVLQNLAFQNSFNWDGSVTQLILQPIIPITTENEMNENFDNIIKKLSDNQQYTSAFANAFEDGQIRSTNILKALGNFMGMMVSNNSVYDQYLRGEAILTAQETIGLSLFDEKCSTCHSGILFTDESFRNNGLTVKNNLPDELGRQAITDDINDYYKFKVPSLRNVAKSGPYMHDGRISNLRRVLDYYDTGVEQTTNLDPILNNNGVLGIPLTEVQKDALEAFLNTLTDEQFLNDERFAAPN